MGLFITRSAVVAVVKSEDESEEEQEAKSGVGEKSDEKEESDEEEEEEDEKKKAAIVVFKLALTFLVFYAKFLESNKNLTVTDEFAIELHSMTDEEIAAVLEKHKVGVNTVVFVVHCFMSWTGAYLSGSATVNMVGGEAPRALAELKLTALLLGQDLDASHYVENETGGHKHLATDAKRALRLPGVAMSQLDPRNQLLLKGASMVLAGLSSTAKPQHDASLTRRGKHGQSEGQGEFFAAPVFLGKWP